ncbi:MULTISPECIES: hypothetical protein [unclassified Arthrobacter]|uniref:hypothetical protein n=1 Tax=unclassified Arthrobacter TaxID=235627 RepID=UPI002DFE8F8B|nr:MULTISPECIES: hypothetical protein [unclassified Arthrobacter]MEC5192597.1 hypothetical protein [Arthrobacter sp. MP_M4]MEC5204081.1 hypothetical protein [Arthrobacter sp. MP_M7]
MDRVESDKFELPAGRPPLRVIAGEGARRQHRPAKDTTHMHKAISAPVSRHV